MSLVLDLEKGKREEIRMGIPLRCLLALFLWRISKWLLFSVCERRLLVVPFASEPSLFGSDRTMFVFHFHEDGDLYGKVPAQAFFFF